ncbi:MAG: N-acetyltransferase [Endomicrobium sp.]|jgi:amino-acid N-acetyltransferase|nr:N-acetyltransferase [Endomicrobium sp.]
MNIRTAKVTDAKEIHELIEFYANNGKMLHRSLNTIYETIQEFVIVERDCKIVACGALHVSLENLAEIKSLAVNKDFVGRGIGRNIVEKLQLNAKNLGVNKIFVLSFSPIFFIKLGFVIIPKEMLPYKIWTECVNCHLFPNCGETSLLFSM